MVKLSKVMASKMSGGTSLSFQFSNGRSHQAGFNNNATISDVKFTLNALIKEIERDGSLGHKRS